MRRAALFTLIICFGAELYLFGAELTAHLIYIAGFPDAAASLFIDPAWKGVSLYAAGRWNEAAEAFAHDVSGSYNLGNSLARAGRYQEAVDSYERALVSDPTDQDAAFNKALLETVLENTRKSVLRRDSGSLSASPAIKSGDSRDRPQTTGGAGGSGAGLASGIQTQGPASAGGKVTKDGAQIASPDAPHPGAAAGAVGAFGDAGRSGEVGSNFPDLLQERQSRMRRRQQEANIHPTLDWLETLPDDPGQYLKAKILAEKARRLKAAGGAIPEDD
jgi:Ca-activated chloride channel family protein